MTIEREPLLTPVAVKDLRPTQITVGMREVTLKRQMIRAQSAKKTGTFLGNHMIPVVLGPKKKNYVIDHHHLARALIEEDVKDVLVADPKIANAVVRSAQRAYIIGAAVGQTNIIFFDGAGQQIRPIHGGKAMR